MRIDYLITNPQSLLLRNKFGVVAGSTKEIIEHFFIPGQLCALGVQLFISQYPVNSSTLILSFGICKASWSKVCIDCSMLGGPQI